MTLVNLTKLQKEESISKAVLGLHELKVSNSDEDVKVLLIILTDFETLTFPTFPLILFLESACLLACPSGYAFPISAHTHPMHYVEVVMGRRTFKFTAIQRKISLSLSNLLSFASKFPCRK